MIRSMLIVVSLVIAGCTTTAALKEPEETGYAMVNCYNGGGMLSWLRGKVYGCKYSEHNLEGVDFSAEILKDGNSNATMSTEVEDVDDPNSP